jgi:divalent metal cation (Fe/Co/Zn/Cd) transporter
MDEHLNDDLIAEIRKSYQVDGIIDTESVLSKAGMKYHVDLHAIVDGNISVKEGHELAHNLKMF